MTDPRVHCPMCGSAQQRSAFVARERMFGMGGAFPGIECDACGSLYLQSLPDLAPFYPAGYHARAGDRPGALRRWVAAWRRRAPYRAWARLVATVAPALRRDAAILDVGCGAGELLASIVQHGYRNVLGIDRFIARDASTANVRILKQTIDATTGSYDLVMFNHALEHVTDPRATLVAALALLRDPQSVLLVRIPICGAAWKQYGIDWVQLDAPRHTFVPTETGLCALFAEIGAVVERVVYDSTPFQFWGSERYRAGGSLGSIFRSLPLTLVYEWIGAVRYGRRVRARNRAGHGDQAAFIVRRPV